MKIADLLRDYRFRTLAVDLWYVVGKNNEFEVLIEQMKDGKSFRLGVRQTDADLNDVVWLIDGTRSVNLLSDFLKTLEI